MSETQTKQQKVERLKQLKQLKLQKFKAQKQKLEQQKAAQQQPQPEVQESSPLEKAKYAGKLAATGAQGLVNQVPEMAALPLQVDKALEKVMPPSDASDVRHDGCHRFS